MKVMQSVQQLKDIATYTKEVYLISKWIANIKLSKEKVPFYKVQEITFDMIFYFKKLANQMNCNRPVITKKMKKESSVQLIYFRYNREHITDYTNFQLK